MMPTTFLILVLLPCVEEPLPRGVVAQGTLLATVSPVRFTDEGDFLVGAYSEGGFVVFPSAPKKIDDPDLRREVEGAGAMSANARWIATRSPEKEEIVVLQVPMLRHSATIQSQGTPIAVSDDGRTILVRKKSSVVQIATATGAVASELECKEGSVEVVDWRDKSGVMVKFGRSSIPEDETPILTLLGVPERPVVLPGRDDCLRVHVATVSPDGRTIAVTYSRNQRYNSDVYLFDLTRGSLLKRFRREESGGDICHAFSPKGRLLAIGGFVRLGGDIKSAFRFIDLNDGAELLAVNCDLDKFICSLQFLADGSQLVTSSTNQKVVIWNTAALIPHFPRAF